MRRATGLGTSLRRSPHGAGQPRRSGSHHRRWSAILAARHPVGRHLRRPRATAEALAAKGDRREAAATAQTFDLPEPSSPPWPTIGQAVRSNMAAGISWLCPSWLQIRLHARPIAAVFRGMSTGGRLCNSCFSGRRAFESFLFDSGCSQAPGIELKMHVRAAQTGGSPMHRGGQPSMVSLDRKRGKPAVRWRPQHAPALVPAGPAWAHRQQVWLRRRPLRCVHRPRRGAGGTLLHDFHG